MLPRSRQLITARFNLQCRPLGASDVDNNNFSWYYRFQYNTVILEGNGGVTLTPALSEDFSGPGIPIGWSGVHLLQAVQPPWTAT